MSYFISLVERMEQIIDHTFANKFLAVEALQMAEPAMNVHIDGLERKVRKSVDMAVLGDSVVSTVLCSVWYKTINPTGQPLKAGHWDIVRKELLGNSNLAQVGRAAGLQDCIVVNAGITTISDKMIAQTVEAIIGAVFLDADNDAKGMDAARSVSEHPGLLGHPLLSVPGMAYSGGVDESAP